GAGKARPGRRCYRSARTECPQCRGGRMLRCRCAGPGSRRPAGAHQRATAARPHIRRPPFGGIFRCLDSTYGKLFAVRAGRCDCPSCGSRRQTCRRSRSARWRDAANRILWVGGWNRVERLGGRSAVRHAPAATCDVEDCAWRRGSALRRLEPAIAKPRFALAHRKAGRDRKIVGTQAERRMTINALAAFAAKIRAETERETDAVALHTADTLVVLAGALGEGEPAAVARFFRNEDRSTSVAGLAAAIRSSECDDIH